MLNAPRRRASGQSFFIKTAVVGVVSAALVGGVAQTAHAAIPTGPTTTGVTGSRPSATTLPFAVSDQVGVAVDVATGNLEVTTAGLPLPGVRGTTAITGTYNSLGWQTGSTVGALGPRWSAGIAGAGSFAAGASGAVVYTAADGATWKFTPGTTAGTFTAPAGFNRVLTSSQTTTPTYTLTDPASGQVITSDADGMPVSVKDRNGNTVAITNTSDVPTTIVSTAGTAAAKTATGSYNSTTNRYTVTQGSGSSARSVQWEYDSTGNVTSYVDGAGNTTTFTYSGNDLTGITSPTGATTTISYSGTTHKVAQVAQSNTTTGAAGTSTTRLSYASSTSTLVAGPDTSLSSAVSVVPHTTYTINAAQHLVNSATDAAGRVRQATYNANGAPTSSTVGSGSTPTSTATYGANNSQSLTKVASVGGASQSLGYNASPAVSAYSPATTTDDAGNQSQLGYDAAGNQTTTSTGSGATAATATVSYNSDGTAATALAPGNGTNTTGYTYTNHQLTGVTPVAITPVNGSAALGAHAYTYDALGRIQSESDGAGRTTSYTYDGDDRVLTESFSDGTPTVTNTYDTAGHLLTQASGSGTITNTWDQLGNLLSTENTADGNTDPSYTYDKASLETSFTVPDGTVTYSYDPSGVLTSSTYPSTSGGTKLINYITDANGRRTDVYLDTNADNSTFDSHAHTAYDASGRITGVQGYVGPSSTNNQKVYDLSYCYNAATAAPNCGTGTTGDRSKVQWVQDNRNNQSTTYTYDGSGRLTRAVIAGSNYPTTPGTWAFGYDIRGNRTSAVFTNSSGTVTSNQTLAFNAANQVTTTGFTYDGAGNLTAVPQYTFAYNGAEQMISATNTSNNTTTAYTYAGADQKSVLSISTEGGNTRTFMYGRADVYGNPTLVTATTNGNRANLQNDPTTGRPLALATPSFQTSLYEYDGTGTLFGTLGNNNSSFDTSTDPYGVSHTVYDGGGDGTSSNPIVFKAGIQDPAVGFIKFGNRWENPYTGTWTQQDTLDSPLDPSNANRYAYAGDDPINGSDHAGAASCASEVGDGVCAGDTYNASKAGAAASKGCGALAIALVPIGAIPGVDVVGLTAAGLACVPIGLKDLFS